ncbi:60S acidic ribosomal protein P2 [Halocaridina rubra]|uniref:Large ribosomal subunit protein P2 n=1 Tax=Halocaridina rubra TaxID=373956 RepID=A0AAN8WT68_HALRR
MILRANKERYFDKVEFLKVQTRVSEDLKNMRYVAAYCLAALGGSTPSAKDIEKVLSSVGVDCDASEAKKVISELEGKDLEELISEGLGKLGSMPVGGGGAPAAGGGGGAAAAPVEEKKEEKAPEPEEESDDDMGFGLFD